MMTSAEIRQQFMDFFTQRHAHTFVPSSPVVPLDDPTLLFTNAGMNQFKPIFLGQERRSYTRAVNTQKCIRAGGKHNDLDDVGRSRRHHTFFEMLGNWSFGDYFKRGAIEMAWELLTRVWKLDPTRLHVSCYEGNEAAGIPRDTEAADLWKQIAGLADDHIHYFGKDNFWEMGDTGPCGPCTEIYIDRTPDKNGGPQVNGEDPRVMEIWNLVFIQYNRDASGKLTPLPAQHVDTGMGLERICQVIQGKDDNFATDLWSPLFEKISQLSGIKYTGQFPKSNVADPVAEAANPQLRHDIAFRVVADHVRCLTFALTDGAVPSNERRGYVLRRILRRAVRFGRQQLGLKEPFMHKLVPVIVESMGGAFPELKKNPGHVAELIKDEEVSFGRTLDRGIQLFDEAYVSALFAVGTARPTPYGSDSSDAVKSLVDDWEKKAPGRVWMGKPKISSQDAFKLHDTYGFPIDLTRIMAEERGMTVDIAGYEKLMEQARELARSGGKTASADKKLTDLPPAAIAQLQQANVQPTNDSAKFSHDPIQAKIMAIWNGDDLGLSPASAFEDEELAVILDRTNFYAEMGGQIGDSGTMRTSLSPGTPGEGGGEGDSTRISATLNAQRSTLNDQSALHPNPPAEYQGREIKAEFDILSTKTIAGYTLHIGRLRRGKIKVGETITAIVSGRRDQTEKNHTSTHLANWALREVLGDGIQQKGSLVDPEKLRFDFSHGKAITDEELEKIESLVEQSIKKNLTVYAEEAPQELALRINGLRAVFGEKYPAIVRVVSIGTPVKDLLSDPMNEKWRQYSIEFCGGTHIKNSGEAQSFAITAEESVSKGIRRIVAVTGKAAWAAANAASQIHAVIAKSKSLPADQLTSIIAELNTTIAGGKLPLRSKRRAQRAVVDLQALVKAFEKSNKATSNQIDSAAIANQLLADAAALNGGKLIVGEIAGASDDQLRGAIDSLKKKSPSYAILLAAASEGKVTFIAAVSDDLIAAGLKAGDWVRETATVAGGSGGGRPQMAQAGGKDAAKIREALGTAKAFAAAKVP